MSSAGAAAEAVHAEPAVTYWRRRFVVLIVALASLVAAAWSLSEALKVQPTLTGHGHATTSHGPSGGAVAPQGGGSPTGAAAGPRHSHDSASGAPAGPARRRATSQVLGTS